MASSGPSPPSQFYDELAPFYHLIYADWEASIARQAAGLESIIREFWGAGASDILDAACGVGTQAIGLAQRGFAVTASDVSPQAVERARREAAKRGLNIECSVADMRAANDHHQRTFDVVIACDNAVPHLLSDSDILKAFEQLYRCARPGGGCLISVRGYAAFYLEGAQVHPYGLRIENGVRYLIFQVWEFAGRCYDLSMYFIKDDGAACEAQVMRTRYYTVTIDRLMELLKQAGFVNAQRLDGRFFQPVIVATRPSGDKG